MTEDEEHEKFFADIEEAYKNMSPEQRKAEKEFTETLDKAVRDGIME